jgi:integrating conjugative element relaxase (TIGR03760 family)
MIELATVILGVLLILGATVIAWRFTRKPPPELFDTKTATIGTHKPASRPAEQLSIETGQALFERTGMTGTVELIRNRLGLSSDNWKNDALPVLVNYAEFVQLLPASESHHHAQPGGLLIHTLEVASYALTARQGMKLPPGATPEDQVRAASVWTMGVLLAAMLHDVGKPISDVLVHLYGEEPRRCLGQWNALAGSMSHWSGASHYVVDFPDQKNYESHQRLGVALLHALVPSRTLNWLATDTRLLPELLSYLDGKDQGVFSEIVSKADSYSVAANLSAGTRVRFARARQAPLIERLMIGLRTLVSEGHVPVNRPGATLFVDPDGEHAWLVSAVIAEKVRKLLEEREQRLGHAAGIPTDNTRLFDTWQEYGASVSPPPEFGKGSVWWVRIDIEGWSQVLTVLKFKMEILFGSDPKIQRPLALRGSITPIDPALAKADRETESRATEEAAVLYTSPAEVGQEDSQSAQIADPSHSPAGGLENLLVQYDSAGRPVKPASKVDTVESRIDQEPPAPIHTAASVSTKVESEFLDAAESVSAMHSTAPASVGSPATVQAFVIPKAKPAPKNKAYGAEARPNAEAFMTWVQQSLGNGELTYNESESVVHFVAEGMALVTPKAFKLYLEQHSYQGDLGSSASPLNALQRDIQKGGYTMRNKGDKSSFHKYKVIQADGQEGTATITTYVIPNPQAYIRPVPSPNPLLVLTLSSNKAEGEGAAPKRAYEPKGRMALYLKQ